MKRKRGRRTYTIVNFKVNLEDALRRQLLRESEDSITLKTSNIFSSIGPVTDDYTSKYCKVSPVVGSEGCLGKSYVCYWENGGLVIENDDNLAPSITTFPSILG
ncbi:hypothetical protein LXL04_017096 [Taraxacum kok-saghyz]